jgi:hypothetical protein
MKNTSVIAAGVAVAAFVVWLVVDSPVLLLVMFFAAAIAVAGRVASPRDIWRAFWPGSWRHRKPPDHDV